MNLGTIIAVRFALLVAVAGIGSAFYMGYVNVVERLPLLAWAPVLLNLSVGIVLLVFTLVLM